MHIIKINNNDDDDLKNSLNNLKKINLFQNHDKR